MVPLLSDRLLSDASLTTSRLTRSLFIGAELIDNPCTAIDSAAVASSTGDSVTLGTSDVDLTCLNDDC